MARLGLPTRFIAWQARSGRSAGIAERHIDLLAEVLDALADILALDLVFVPFFVGAPHDDVSVARRVAARMRHAVAVIEGERRPAVVKGVMACAALGVGTANHFAVFAASSGVPVVALYDTPYMRRKFEGLAALLPGLVLPFGLPADTREVIQAAERLMRDPGRPTLPDRFDALSWLLAMARERGRV
ncbi:MAG: hypothetical protein KatS3mg014_2033 [Actinomycetota bacterium]|nr:MAG: hypothetical protein KatS3mg014_2033 [Actinomycetota bacterium]